MYHRYIYFPPAYVIQCKKNKDTLPSSGKLFTLHFIYFWNQYIQTHRK